MSAGDPNQSGKTLQALATPAPLQLSPATARKATSHSQSVAVTINADVTTWLRMLNDDSAPPFFKKTGSFSKPEKHPDATGPSNVNKYDITHTEGSKKTKIAIQIDPATKHSTFSVKEPTAATAQHHIAITLAAIQASVASIKPPNHKAEPIHFDGFTQVNTACFEGIKAAVQAYYFECLTQTPQVKPSFQIQSSDSEANTLLQTAIKEGQQAAFDQIKKTKPTMLEQTTQPTPDNMHQLLTALDTLQRLQSDVVACRAPSKSTNTSPRP